MKLEIQGARRTGTNYTTSLLDLNLPDHVELSNFEEGRNAHVPQPPQDGYQVLVTAKHPQAWLLSLEKYLSREHTTVIQSAAHLDRLRRTLLESYIAKYQAWCEAQKRPGYTLIRYEDLIGAEDGYDLADTLNAALPWGKISINPPAKDIHQRVERHDGDTQHLRSSTVDRDYYLERQWADEFTPEQMELFDTSIHTPAAQRVLDTLGYELEDPRDDEEDDDD